MEQTLQQIFLLITTVLGGVCAIELCLYWLLYRFNVRGHLALSALFGAASGGLFYLWLALGEDGAGFSLTSALVWGGGVGAVLSLLARWYRGRYATAVMMMAPAFFVISVLIIYPFFFELHLAFTNLNMYRVASWLSGGELKFVGFDNFVKVFTTSPLQSVTFWELLGRTIIWTIANVVFHVAFGLGLAMLLNRSLKGRAIYRTLLIIPWAMPQVVAILVWRGEFHPQFGFVNMFVESLGFSPISWWSEPIPVFLSCLIVNIWLGIPFMMIVFLGGLQNIPGSLYEAAEIDGASRWFQFWQITLPMLKPTVVPSVTLGTIWTFNNINVIYLMTGQDGGNEYADILISALFKSAFTYSRYSFSAAFAVVMFAILFGMAYVWIRISRVSEEATA